MSGLIAIYNRDGSPVDTQAAHRMMSALRYRGPDGSSLVERNEVALGHQHFWTTPEEAGERQPLESRDGRLCIAFDGRIDNRDELIAALDLGLERAEISDAMIAMLAYERWEQSVFERMLGPFAIVIHDRLKRQLICARDALGSRTLFYHLSGKTLVVASEQSALLCHPAVSERLDEAAVAQFYAVRIPSDGRTFYSDVSELLPAHAMAVEALGHRVWRYWSMEPQERVLYRRDEQYGEQFRALLTESVRCRLRCVSTPAVLMSGGLDSSSIAAIAARELSQSASSKRLRSISWVFDELAECDESRFIDELINECGLDAIKFAGDECWTLRDGESWTWNKNSPADNPYRRLKERAYRYAAERGTRVVFTGGFGDHLYTGAEQWLKESLCDLRFARACGELLDEARMKGFGAIWKNPGVRYIGGRVLDYMPYARGKRAARKAAKPRWLTDHALKLLPEESEQTLIAPAGYRQGQYTSLLGPVAAWSASAEIFHTSRAGIELRHPYRDRRLIGFMLSVPAYQLYRGGLKKYIVREAMKGILPESVRLRTQTTYLSPLYKRGLFDRESHAVSDLLSDPEAVWAKYVRREWLSPQSLDDALRRNEGIEAVLLWRAVSMELWRRGHAKEKLAARAQVGLPLHPTRIQAP